MENGKWKMEKENGKWKKEVFLFPFCRFNSCFFYVDEVNLRRFVFNKSNDLKYGTHRKRT